MWMLVIWFTWRQMFTLFTWQSKAILAQLVRTTMKLQNKQYSSIVITHKQQILRILSISNKICGQRIIVNCLMSYFQIIGKIDQSNKTETSHSCQLCYKRWWKNYKQQADITKKMISPYKPWRIQLDIMSLLNCWIKVLWLVQNLN